MKKVFFILAIFSWSLITVYSFAQSPGGGQTPPIITQEEGEEYNPLPGMPGGGTQSTGALNGQTPPDTTAGVGAPQSGASQLQQCSKIRFLSLLDILIWIKCIIVVAIIPLIFALALAVFLWGVMKFIATSDPAKRKEGKNFIIGGLIGLFVMTSLWGIIKIVGNTLGTGSAVPVLQTSSLKKTN